MRTSIVFLACIAFIFASGCKHAEADLHSSNEATTTSPGIAFGPEARSELVLGLSPGHHFDIGPWSVEVGNNDSLKISRAEVNGRTSIKIDSWKPLGGSLVFVESTERLWAYDGDHNLGLVKKTENTWSVWGPSKFPYEIPQEVKERLPNDLDAGGNAKDLQPNKTS
ncbi:hypothetical protein GC207_15150 [bacterium]|nr:hypothetical protein [bacterium]